MYCPQGKYANETGSPVCNDCPAGRYGSRPTETRHPREGCAGLCAAGHYGEPGASSSTCAGACPKGSYSRPGAISCRLCPEGRYGNVAGNGVVGFTTPVCTGECWGAAVGSVCCDRLVLWQRTRGNDSKRPAPPPPPPPPPALLPQHSRKLR